MKGNKKQIVIVSIAVMVLVALFFAPKVSSQKPKASKETKESHEHLEYVIEVEIDSAKNLLLPKDLELVNEQESLLRRNRELASDSLIKLWLSFRFPSIAAYYTEQVAIQGGKSDLWSKAGSRYYAAAKFGKPDQQHIMFEKAIKCFNKTLELVPSDLEAKTNLGICYVEGTGEPMKGISLLKEVVSTDSTNINAHLNLALFAVQSGQYDKAVERFEKILVINPEYIEAYLYLGQTYASQGNKQKATEVLEKYKALSNDGLINAEIDKYIKDLKNS